MARYQRDDDNDVLSHHRTRQGALNGWRERFRGQPIEISRTYGDSRRVLVVDGIWHLVDE